MAYVKCYQCGKKTVEGDYFNWDAMPVCKRCYTEPGHRPYILPVKKKKLKTVS